jgi:hypothetical protein
VFLTSWIGGAQMIVPATFCVAKQTGITLP